MGEQGGSPELLAALAEDVVVVVAAGEPELVKRLTDPLTDERRLSEVEWCALDGRDRPGRNQVLVDRGVVVRVYRQLVIEDVT